MHFRPIADASLSRLGSLIVAGTVGCALGLVLSFELFGMSLVTPVAAALFAITLTVGSAYLLFWPDDVEVARELDHSSQSARIFCAERRVAQSQLAAAECAFHNADQALRRAVEILQSNLNRLLTCNWRQLTGVPFEQFLVAVFWEHGYQVSTTKTSGDQGIDLILSHGPRRIAVQAKGYVGGTVGNGAVQEAHTGKFFYNCHTAAVITNSTFTRAARELASGVGCALIDGDELPNLIRGTRRL